MDGDMTVEKCTAAGAAKGYTTCGLEFSTQCFCANALGSASKEVEYSECSSVVGRSPIHRDPESFRQGETDFYVVSPSALATALRSVAAAGPCLFVCSHQLCSFVHLTDCRRAHLHRREIKRDRFEKAQGG